MPRSFGKPIEREIAKAARRNVLWRRIRKRNKGSVVSHTNGIVHRCANNDLLTQDRATVMYAHLDLVHNGSIRMPMESITVAERRIARRIILFPVAWPVD